MRSLRFPVVAAVAAIAIASWLVGVAYPFPTGQEVLKQSAIVGPSATSAHVLSAELGSNSITKTKEPTPRFQDHSPPPPSPPPETEPVSLKKFLKSIGQYIARNPWILIPLVIPILVLLVVLLGFGAGGVVAGSAAAAIHSMIGVVATGSVFAFLQSLGAGGFAAAVVALAWVIVTAVVLFTALVKWLVESGISWDAVVEVLGHAWNVTVESVVGVFKHAWNVTGGSVVEFFKRVWDAIVGKILNW